MKMSLRPILLLCLVWATIICGTNSDPDKQQSSSFAFNNDGKGQVTVSCNGKTYTGEGVAACTSSASRFEYGTLSRFFCLLIPGTVQWLTRA